VASIGRTATGPVEGKSRLPACVSDASSTWAPSAAGSIDPWTAAGALRTGAVVAAVAGTVDVTASADVVGAALEALTEVGADGRVVATVGVVDALVEVGDGGRVDATVDVAAVDGTVVVHATAGAISSATPAVAHAAPMPICASRRLLTGLVLLVTEMFLIIINLLR
jgi:hypothetical protein